MLSSIYFNKKNSLNDLNISILDLDGFDVLNEKIEKFDGSNILGSLTKKYKIYEDRSIKIKFKLRKYKVTNMFDQLSKIYNWIDNIIDNKLWFSFYPSKCFLVKHVKKENINSEIKNKGSFTLEFVCEPFLYYTINEPTIILNSKNDIYYDGVVEGYLKLKIFGTGDIQVTINDSTIQIKNLNDHVIIDSKYKNCLNPDGSSKSIDMIGQFQRLVPGMNKISWIGNVSKIEIDKRSAFKQ